MTLVSSSILLAGCDYEPPRRSTNSGNNARNPGNQNGDVAGGQPGSGNDDGTSSELSSQELEYLMYAGLIRASNGGESRKLPVLGFSEDTPVGRVEGSFRIVQVIDDNVGILDKVDEYGIPIFTTLVRGANFTAKVDGEMVSFGDDSVYRYTGPFQYTTVLGATRTIHSIQALDHELLASAFEHYEREDAEREAEAQAQVKQQEHLQQERLEQAKAGLEEARAELQALENNNEDIEQYINASDKVAMYKPVAKNNERVKALLEDAQNTLRQLGNVSETDVEEYRTKKQRAQETVKQALQALRELEQGSSNQKTGGD